MVFLPLLPLSLLILVVSIMVNYHLVVLVHGVWGNLSHMSYLAHQIENNCSSSDPDERIIVHKTGSHSGYLTYDGVDVNGKRIRDEIVETADGLNGEDGKVTKFSLIGYSMGGLVARYALGILYHDGFFDQVQPIHFVTFCTPHVGVVNPSNSLLSRIFNFVAPFVLAHTGQQFFLIDKKLVGNKEYVPLLQWMSDPASRFYKALELFETRSLYANTINDRRTSWYTTSISNLDPFNSMVNESLSAYKLEYVDGYLPTVIDFRKPITFKKVERGTKPAFNFKRFLYKSLTWLQVLGHFLLITPIYSLYLLGNFIWQRVKMNRRLRAFYLDGAESLGVLYDMMNEELESVSGEKDPSSDIKIHDVEKQSNVDDDSEDEEFLGRFGDKMSDETDVFIESVFSALNSASYYDYHYSVTKSPASTPSDHLDDPDSVPLLGKNNLINLKGQEITTDFKLNLTEPQEIAVANLNTLKWNKYPVIIRNTRTTHAAVIYRHPDPDFEEGKVVVRHFVEQVFKV